MKTDILLNGSHLSKNGIRIPCNTESFVPIVVPVLVSNSVDDRSGQPDETPIERGNPLNSEIPEWLQEFMENLVDDEIPVHGDSHASSSHEVSFEFTFKRRGWGFV